MQIILKQRQIEAALKQYVAAQGINLAGKNVSVEFTAGRKETGLSAEIDIADTEDLLVATPMRPVVVANQPVSTTAAVTALDAAPEAPAEDAVPDAVVAASEAASSARPATSSLFN